MRLKIKSKPNLPKNLVSQTFVTLLAIVRPVSGSNVGGLNYSVMGSITSGNPPSK